MAVRPDNRWWCGVAPGGEVGTRGGPVEDRRAESAEAGGRRGERAEPRRGCGAVRGVG